MLRKMITSGNGRRRHKPSALSSQCFCVVVFLQLLRRVRLFATTWTAAHQVSLSFSLPELAQTHVYQVGDAIQPSHPLFVPFSSCLQSFPALSSFPMSQIFASGGQHIGASASASVFPMNIQDWFSLGLSGLISLQSKGLSRVFSNTTVQKHQLFGAQPSLWSNSHIHTTLIHTGKTIALIKWTLSAKECFCFLIRCLGLS